ncbi:MAG TPA: tetratricopeptide repeat protein, partial [Candidatus Ozemobacteraceae bacterium]|nr:tetratricopeptide repeat protein [Candidatus Ozemobacteraceae bacterium]
KHFTAALSSSADKLSISKNLGVIFMDKGLLDQAESEFKRAISIKSDDPFTLNNMGKLLVLKNRREEGIEFFKRALLAQPDYGYAHYNLGKTYREIKDYPHAIYHLLFCLKYEPEDIYAMNSLGRTFYEAGLHENAIEIFQRVIERHDEDDAYAVWGLAQCHEAMGNLESALSHYQALQKLAEDNKALQEIARARVTALRGR